jgi:hypothetical protein
MVGEDTPGRHAPGIDVRRWRLRHPADARWTIVDGRMGAIDGAF